MKKDIPIDQLDGWIKAFRPHLTKEERFLIRDELLVKVDKLMFEIVNDQSLDNLPWISTKQNYESKMESNQLSI